MIQFTVLGRLALRRSALGGLALDSVLGQPKRTALLAYLALGGPAAHLKERLLALFWPESSEDRARNSLNQVVFQLRRTLGDDVLETSGEALRLDPNLFQCDAIAFQAALQRGDLEQALSLYKGDLMPGFHLAGCLDFERWLEAERASLAHQAVAAAVSLVEREDDAGNGVGAVHWLRLAISWAPYEEALVRRLMALLDRLGDRAGAVREYERFRERVAGDLQVDPSPETRALVEGWRSDRGTPDAAVAAAAQGGGMETALRSDEADSVTLASGTPSLGWRWRPVLAAASGIVVLGILIGAIVNGRRPHASGPTGTPRVAVLPFTVEGDTRLRYLSEGLVDLLSAKLDVPGQFRSVDPRAVLAVAGDAPHALDPARGQALAARLDATMFVLGSVLEAGGRLEMNARLYEVGGRRIGSATVPLGDEAAVFEAVDRMTRDLVAEYSQRRGDQFSRTAAVTTVSLPALKAFLEGERALRRGDYSGAVAAFERAVEADTSFTLAHFRLGIAADWAGRTPLRNSSLERAWADRARLPERERLLLAARRVRSAQPAEAEQLLRSVVTRHPDDTEAWAELADLLFHASSWGTPTREVSDAFDRALRYDSSNTGGLIHLARLAAFERDHTRLDSLVTRALALGATGLGALELRTLRAFALRDVSGQQAVLAELRRLDDGTLEWLAFRTAAYSGEFRDAANLADLLIDPGRAREIRAVGFLLHAQLQAAQGRLTAAHQYLASAAELDGEAGLSGRAFLAVSPLLPISDEVVRDVRRALHQWDRGEARQEAVGNRAPSLLAPHLREFLLGVLSARLGDTSAALARASELGADSEVGRVIRAWVELEKGRSEEGVRLVGAQSRSAPVEPMGLLPMLRAELLRTSGRTDEALRWYATMTGELPWALSHVAPAHLRQAEIYDARGQAGGAVRHYARFIDLWSDCDPDLKPAVEAARARLAQLQPDRSGV